VSLAVYWPPCYVIPTITLSGSFPTRPLGSRGGAENAEVLTQSFLDSEIVHRHHEPWGDYD
jgi:hypothetical protein